MYSCLHLNSYSIDEYRLESLRESDIYEIKEWRNTQIDVLRQNKTLTDEDQYNYYHKAIKPTFKAPFPQQILFSFFKKDVLIGYGGIVHISWIDKRGEISFLLATDRAKNSATYKNDFEFFLKLIKLVAFKDLQFNKITTETFDIRDFHVSILEKNGFALEGRMKKHVFISDQFVDSLIHGCLYENYVTE